MRHPFAGAAASFAHLAGLGRRATRAETDDRKDDQAKGKRAEDDDGKDPDAKGDDDNQDPDAKGKRAEGEDEEAKGKRAEDDDNKDPDAEDEDDKKDAKAAKGKGQSYAAGRADERKRCALIFATPHAAGQAHVAARLAFSTNLSATEAIGLLAETSASIPQGKHGLGERMANVPSPAVGPDGGAGPEKGSAAETVARMTAAYDRATGGAAKK
jgi:hypothetical protein